jgi:hypothetical protein
MAIKHPRFLRFEGPDIEGNYAVIADDGRGGQMAIYASRHRWNQVMLNPTASRADVARQMFERDEITVDEFERAIGGGA